MTQPNEEQSLVEWFAAEAAVSGKPMMVRGRKVLSSHIPNSNLSFLFVVTLRYGFADATALPTSDQYKDIADFEGRVLDGLEFHGLGLLTFVETHNGVVRYYCYVRDIDSAVEWINKQNDGKFTIEFSADEDPQWVEYRRLMSHVCEAE